MKLKKTNRALINFVNTANQTPVGAETKIAKKLGKQAKVFISAIEPYNESLEEAQIDNCSVDEKGNILRDEKGNYVYSKEGLKKLTVKTKELLNKEVEVEVFLTTQDILSCPVSHRNYYNEFISAEGYADTYDVDSTTDEKSDATTSDSTTVSKENATEAVS